MRLNLICLLLLGGAAALAQVTAITAGTLIDPETGTEKSKQIILVEDGKIKAIGPDVRVPSNATRVDLSR